MADNKETAVLYVLDWNIPTQSDGELDYFRSGRIAVGRPGIDNKFTTLMDHERMPDGIEAIVDGEGAGRIYWTQMGHPEQNDGVVQSAKLDGLDIRALYSNGEIHTPKQLAIDAARRKLYVCDREGMRVHRSNLDGSEKEVLVQSGDFNHVSEVTDKRRHCVGIAIDNSGGKFYWTQKGPSEGGQGRILRVQIQMPEGQTASTRTDIEVLFENLSEPIDLAILAKTRTLYWTDRGDFPKGNTLKKVALDILSDHTLSGREDTYQILAERLHEAVGVQVDETAGHIYVTDLGGCVYRYDMDGKNRLKLFEDQGVYTGLALAYVNGGVAEKLSRRAS